MSNTMKVKYSNTFQSYSPKRYSMDHAARTRNPVEICKYCKDIKDYHLDNKCKEKREFDKYAWWIDPNES